ncbi:hypothetical protein F5Y08DRAFT_338937 [Xylaria arbuscula]|nr:hypothetical protein F5Y08DRAFT_338937 [Xylaria arbuscula]
MPNSTEDQLRVLMEPSLPPIEVMAPDSVLNQKTADEHNATILEVRGWRTTATGDRLLDLATSALFYNCIFNAPDILTSWTPFYFFFYGTLQVPHVLQTVCRLSPAQYNANPLCPGAQLMGWRVMMWGQFPALVPANADDDPVPGKVWKCEDPMHLRRLCGYEGTAYRMAYCTIRVPAADGSGRVETIYRARTFVSAVPDDLEEGSFNLAPYGPDC